MPLFRSLTTKIKTSLSPSSSSSSETSPTSPTSPHVSSSFEKVSGRKEGNANMSVKRPEAQARVDSFMTQGSNASHESVEERKQRRISRFREELDCDEADE
ncbi:hypothetical protein BDW02DRAFT_565488 [Decorospora gaudefroyi]|uniref:Uncharacterized protein n=1 Tax=Decorospora gaudefroyi TaxID=184978 RepID=A0A6A5KU11_9PLEO|nr:hypothetical protein BDW02DRAFT_565488 [Decorospora gaudefroyi]